MNLIPALWKILWDVWNVRMLVLLSLALQIILFVFGKRRKNMASQWINVVVWLAYITADSVATVALGKLSYAQTNISNPNNALQALWAPLLLLHLGGPDTITAYSLEDNQLWIRHFLGMGIQAIVTIYVIVMSWRYFWFSFMLIPTFVAGIIKYGERTWALKLACLDKSGHILPFYSLAADSIKKEERYKNVLIMAHVMVKEFKKYIENYDIGRFSFTVRRANSEAINSMAEMNRNDDTYFKDVLEVEMGLMYDLLYTKAPITFAKRGCIFRSISFTCTVSVLVGFFQLIAMEAKWNEQQYSMVDIVITGVLLVGALALEIYAAILLSFSDWAMLWLIKCGRGKWAIRLWQKFPWFFEKKKWSKKMGQFDLFGEEDKRRKWSRILGRLGIQDEFNRYMVSIPPTLYPVILKFISAAATDNPINLGSLAVFFASTTFGIQMVIMYIITDICCRCDDTRTSENTANSCGHVHDDDKETCKTLSHYMMYLLLTCRSLLPVVVSDSELTDFTDQARVWFSVMKSKAREEGCESSPSDMIKHFIAGARHHYQEKVERVQDRQGAKLGLVEAMDFFYEYVIIELVDKDDEKVKWEKLKIAWLAMLCYAAISSPKNCHLQQLKGGGEFLSLVWFLIPQSHIFCDVDTFTLNGFFNKYFH